MVTAKFSKFCDILSTVLSQHNPFSQNEIMVFSATWLDLDIVILSEVSQAKKKKYHVASLYAESEKK